MLISSLKYHGRAPLIYSYPSDIGVGSVVSIPFGKTTVSGIVLGPTSKPEFDTKDIECITTKPLPSQLLDLHRWLEDYYPGPQGSITQLFLPSNLSSAKHNISSVATLEKAIISNDLPSLTSEQRHSVERIRTEVGPYLLHGNTGTGKTRVYQELILDTLSNNRSTIILVPEIGLTSQLISEVHKIVNPDNVVLFHSNLTPAQRKNSWLKIHRSSSPLVIIGPRSALFTPINNLGLIIIDECHDAAYKQEQTPRYHANLVAARLARLHKAKLILGSATPSLVDYFMFKEKSLPIIRLVKPAMRGATVNVTTVDVKNKQNFNKSPWLSDLLINKIQDALTVKQQSLLFLNRRGTARVVICQNCDWQAICPNCDLPLTYHNDKHSLRCHTCGHKALAPNTCLSCGSAELLFKAIGTKAVIDELRRIFPGASTLRFDSDNHKADSLNEQFSSLKAGAGDIIVGTQMLSKGLDLPNLSVVGLISADSSLGFPDFSSEEKTFQVINQVIGRVGRGHLPGEVVVQTLQPNNKTIQNAMKADYAAFYTRQTKERQLYSFPPFCFILKIWMEKPSRAKAEEAMTKLVDSLKGQGIPIRVSEPLPAFTEKVAGKYRWQIIVRSSNRKILSQLAGRLPGQYYYDIDPQTLL